MNHKDLFGRALYDYQFNHKPEDLETWTHLTDREILPIAYLFRKYEEMPEIEKIALDLCHGKILDVGAGSGIHSKYLQGINKDVTALDFSEWGHKVLQAQGLKKIIQSDFFELHHQKYDTILLLMNGVGIVEKAIYTDRLFKKLDELLIENGIAFIHSSDLKYLFESGGGYAMPSDGYYGDVQFFISYKGETEKFDWTYIDAQTLQTFAFQNGFNSEIIYESEYGDFLMEIKR